MGMGPLLSLLSRLTSARATKIDNLDATVSSRASSTQAEDIKGTGFSSSTDSLKILSDTLDAIKGSGFATGTHSLVKIARPSQDVQEAVVSNQPSSLSDGTTYTVLSLSGTSGVLISVGAEADTGDSARDWYVLVTVDGGTERTIHAYDCYLSGYSNYFWGNYIPFGIRFNSSLVVKIKTSSNGNYTLDYCQVLYAEDI